MKRQVERGDFLEFAPCCELFSIKRAVRVHHNNYTAPVERCKVEKRIYVRCGLGAPPKTNRFASRAHFDFDVPARSFSSDARTLFSLSRSPFSATGSFWAFPYQPLRPRSAFCLAQQRANFHCGRFPGNIFSVRIANVVILSRHLYTSGFALTLKAHIGFVCFYNICTSS
jgi:hypothetical protein